MLRPDVRLSRRGAEQYGVVTWDDALAAGLTPRQIERRIASGSLVPVHRRVYVQPAAAPSDHQPLMAACLAAEGVASNRSAAVVYGLRGVKAARPEITVPRGRSARLAGVIVHRAELDRRDVAVKDKIPLTTPARTLLDLAGSAPSVVEHALEDTLNRDLTTIGRLYRLLERAGGRGCPGTAVLRDLLDTRDNGQAPTQSEMEDAFIAMVRRHRLPEPVRQYPLLWPPVDFAYPECRVAIETDGRRFHGGRRAQARDRRRDREARAQGWVLIRVVWEDLVEVPGEVAADIAAQLRRVA
jgi:very-short-patch-repair endonuclease